MIMEHRTAITSYLARPANSFWQWSEDGEVVEWALGGNHTIAFRGELRVVLQRVATRGLPPLGAVLLLLAAGRDSWDEDKRIDLRNLARSIGSDGNRDLSQKLAHVLLHLDRVRSILPDMRPDPQAIAELAGVVFETVRPPELPVDDILETLLSPVDVGASMPLTAGKWLWELRLLEPGLKHLDADTFSMRFQTGLDTEILPADVEEPLAQKIQRLFSRLDDDEELSGIARLARNLMAVVNLPRPLDDSDDVPVGGVSDISNRGSLDRLLISELAQDDHTLMLRVAMNEALYLRRETPPRNPPRSRIVILDAGLRLWGTPRVFATSVALSLAAMSDPSVAMSILRPEGDRLAETDLSSRAGLIEHLKALQPESHPGRSLGAIHHSIDEQEGDTDIVLITGADVLADPAFRRDLDECEPRVSYVMSVSRDGGFQLLQLTAHGIKRLRAATLDLDRLLAPAQRPSVPLVDPEVSKDLPAILRVQPFPLRLPHAVVPAQTWRVSDECVLSVTNDGRLVCWELHSGPKQAPRQIIDKLACRHVLWRRGTERDGQTEFVIGNPGRPHLWLVTVDLDTDRCHVAPLSVTDSAVLAVCDHAGALFVIHKRCVDVCDSRTGVRLQSLNTPHDCRWINDRYFRTAFGFSALSHDGTTARLEEIVNHSQCGHLWDFLTMFDVDGVQGPVGLSMRDGSLYFTADQETRPLSKPINGIRRVLSISQDGRWVCVETMMPSNTRMLIDTVQLVGRTMYETDPVAAVQSPVLSPLYSRSIRSRISAIGSADRTLVLKTRRSRLLWLNHDDFNDRLYLKTQYDSNDVRSGLKTPQTVSTPDSRGLRTVAWSDGSEAFLDKRGMLHLRSSDPGIPEATLVLHDNNVSGWCADGRQWGDPYFLNETGVSPGEIWNDVIKPFCTRLA